MSSDIIVTLEEVLKQGCSITTKYNKELDAVESLLTIPTYLHTRTCEMHESQLVVPCGGKFREWFKVYLESKNINFNEY